MTLHKFLKTRDNHEKVVIWCDYEYYGTEPQDLLLVKDLKKHSKSNKQMIVGHYKVARFADTDKYESLIIYIHDKGME